MMFLTTSLEQFLHALLVKFKSQEKLQVRSKPLPQKANMKRCDRCNEEKADSEFRFCPDCYKQIFQENIDAIRQARLQEQQQGKQKSTEARKPYFKQEK